MGIEENGTRSAWRAFALSRAAAMVLFLGLAAPICMVGIASTDVITMEGIVAEGARHMARSGDYLVPTLNGEPYTYKPPLAYWMAAASFAILGESAWTMRLPFALSAIGLGAVVLVYCRRALSPTSALVAGVAALTGGVTVQKLHLAEWDIPLAFAMGTAIVAASWNLASDRPRARDWFVCYLAFACAVLVKGGAAVLFFVPGLALALAVSGRWKELVRTRHLLAALAGFAVIALYVAAALGAAGAEVFVQPLAEARDKGFAWGVSEVAGAVVKPIEVWAAFLPWSVLVPLSFGRARRLGEGAGRFASMALCFLGAGLVVYLLVPGSEVRYLMPLSAPLAVVCGVVVDRDPPRWRGTRGVVIRVLAVAVAIAATVVAIDASEHRLAGRLALVALAALLVLGAWPQPGLRRRGSPVWVLMAVALTVWFVQVEGTQPHRAKSRSLRPVASSFERLLPPETHVWTRPVSKHFRHSSLFFYLDRPVRTFRDDGESPAAGEPIVLFEDEHEGWLAAPTLELEILAREPHQDTAIVLARVAPRP